MSQLTLEGGTDAAEMAIFAIQDLPDEMPDGEGADALQARGSLVRLSTGDDGNCRARLFIDEEVPWALSRFRSGDPWSGRLRLPDGRLGFGGIESAWRGFPANPAIRNDATLASGEYEVTAFLIEIPRDAMQRAIDDRIGGRAARILRVHRVIVFVYLVLIAGAGVVDGWPVAAALTGIGAAAEVAFRRSPVIRRLDEEKRAVERGYPAIVIQLRTRRTGEGPA